MAAQAQALGAPDEELGHGGVHVPEDLLQVGGDLPAQQAGFMLRARGRKTDIQTCTRRHQHLEAGVKTFAAQASRFRGGHASSHRQAPGQACGWEAGRAPGT
jgi:hypothetical protein